MCYLATEGWVSDIKAWAGISSIVRMTIHKLEWSSYEEDQGYAFSAILSTNIRPEEA